MRINEDRREQEEVDFQCQCSDWSLLGSEPGGTFVQVQAVSLGFLNAGGSLFFIRRTVQNAKTHTSIHAVNKKGKRNEGAQFEPV